MALKTRVVGAGKLLLTTGGLLATYLLFAAASMRLAIRAREVQVPDFANRTVSEASGVASDVGLALKIDDATRMDPKIGAGRIVGQEPAAGSTARSQRTVRVWLSAGRTAATVPGVTGDNQRTAQLALNQAGFTPVALSEIRSRDYAADTVVAQDPPAKTAAASVALLVNRGVREERYVMPDLIGTSGDRAAEALRERGFRVAVVGSNPYPGAAAGVVLRQNPQGGFPISPGDAISLEVSQ